jgi:hypothetical protein
MRTYVPNTPAREAAPQPPEEIATPIHAFDDPWIDGFLPAAGKALSSLESLRNRALLYALANSGACIS